MEASRRELRKKNKYKKVKQKYSIEQFKKQKSKQIERNQE